MITDTMASAHRLFTLSNEGRLLSSTCPNPDLVLLFSRYANK